MNILRRHIQDRLNCDITYGSITVVRRKMLNLEKTHYNDSIAVSGIESIKEDTDTAFFVKQFRKKKRSLHEATARKGRKTPNTESRRNAKNTKTAKGFYLNDKVRVFDRVGYISGFCKGGCYIKDSENRYITIPGKSYKQVGYKNVEFICHCNNWNYEERKVSV